MDQRRPRTYFLADSRAKEVPGGGMKKVISNLSRSFNLDVWDGLFCGKLVMAPKSAVAWMDAAYEKGWRDAQKDIKKALGIKL